MSICRSVLVFLICRVLLLGPDLSLTVPHPVFADGASTEHTRKPRVHCRDHVRVLQRTGAVHRCAGQAPLP